jgi:hypothetical protein
MLIVDKDSVTATRQKIADSKKINQAINDVKKMLEIKEALLWRSEGMAPCCGSLANISAQLTHEVEILENTLTALEDGNRAKAADLLDKYAHILEENREREPSQPNYC